MVRKLKKDKDKISISFTLVANIKPKLFALKLRSIDYCSIYVVKMESVFCSTFSLPALKGKYTSACCVVTLPTNCAPFQA